MRRDGDLTVILLSGDGILFTRPIDDDWYRATTPWGSIYYTTDTGRLPTWRPDVSASPMGCLEQFQWCNSAYPRDRGCGPLASWIDSLYGAAPLFNVTSETLDADRPLSSGATSARIIWPFLAMNSYPVTVTELLGSLGTRSLASQATLFNGLQSSLPGNQWQLDVLQWWHTILAAVQASRLVDIPLFFALRFCLGFYGLRSQMIIWLILH